MSEKAEKVKDYMNKKGYSIFMSSGNGSSLMFSPKSGEVPHIVTVYVNTDEFSASYFVPQSINVLSTPKCGSVFNEQHFDGIINRFKEQVKVLDDAFNTNGKCVSCRYHLNDNTCGCKDSIHSNEVVERNMSCVKHRPFC